MADGTLRVSVDVEPRHAQAAFAMFGAPGTPVAIARLTQQAAVAETRREQAQPEPPADYGKHYEILWKRGFFNNPRVRAAFAVEIGVPRDRIDEQRIKELIYSHANISSLTELHPSDFIKMMRVRNLDAELPRGFGEGA